MENKRIYLFDNIKAILIFLVVFGHTIEESLNLPFYKTLYIIIYSFHMPAFIYISGYLASYNPKKIAKTLFFPYLVFQWGYFLFHKFILQGTGSTYSLVLPYWLLWYLPALAIFKCMLPFFETDNKRKAGITVLITFVVGLIAGYNKNLGYYLTTSRVTVFFPFFLMAYYHRKFMPFEKFNELRKNNLLKILLFAGVVLICALATVFHDKVDVSWLYGSYSYEAGKSTVFVRLALYVCALIWIMFLNLVVTEKRLRVITNTGINCLFVYLLHGFVIKLMVKNNLHVKFDDNIFVFLIITLFMVLIFSSKITEKILKPLVQFPERRIKNGNNSCNEQ